jgi:hypothetical protein
MMEMRWLTKTTGDRVLQYRQMVDKTVYAHANTSALSREWINNGHRNMQWSEWVDVREVIE